MKKNVIVTGGAGFIGSILCKTLVQNSYNPIIIDNLSTGFKDLAKYGKLFIEDYGNYKKTMEIFEEFKPLAIFHIAAYKDVVESINNPDKYYKNNVEKTETLIKACIDSSLKHFIFSSSAAIFGEIKDDENINENYPPNPINPYGKSKLMGEELLEKYHRSDGLIYSSLRYFNVSGADPKGELGEKNKNAKNIFPILSKAVFKEEEFTIFGDDYDTKDGTCIRDYIHVYDLANAHIKAFEKQLKNKRSIKINLGNEIGFSVKELIKNFQQISGKKIQTRIGPRRQGDPSSVIANNNLAKKYLDFKPKYTDIKDHISHQLNWYKNYKLCKIAQ